MAARLWTLTDAKNDVFVEDLTIGPEDVASFSQGGSFTKRTHRGGLRDGVESIKVTNGELSFVVLPTRGMGLWKAWLGEDEYGWKSPVRGPVHPKFVPLAEPSGLGWLDGFDELLVRCGLQSNGAPEFDDNHQLRYPLHGRVGNLPAQLVQVEIDGEQDQIAVYGEVEETRFHFAKLRLKSRLTTRAGDSGMTISDEIENISDSPQDAQMLYHFNIGLPMLDAGSSLVAPVKTLVPRNDRAAEGIQSWNSYQAPEPGFEEQVYFFALHAARNGETRVLLKNAHGTRGVSLIYDVSTLPCFTLWKNTTSAADGYVTGIEPGTNFPNPRSFEGAQNRVARLGPGEKVSFRVRIEFYQTPQEVEAAEQAVIQIQGSSPPVIHKQPQAGWCAG